MFEQLEKYNSGHFFFDKENELQNVCNAPKKGIGVYVVYALKNGKIELVYIGSLGRIKQDGTIEIGKSGIFNRLVNEKQFDEPIGISWKQKIISENIDVLDIYWYETFDKNYYDIPISVKGRIIQDFFDINGRLPKWNTEF